MYEVEVNPRFEKANWPTGEKSQSDVSLVGRTFSKRLIDSKDEQPEIPGYQNVAGTKAKGH
jgi:hypothetical protein